MYIIYSISDLRRCLVQFYREKSSKISLSPFSGRFKEHPTSLYVPPKILICDNKLGSEQTFTERQYEAAIRRSTSYEDTKYVTSYGSLFNKQSELQNNIYIQGEPGMGKSTFATMLALDWVTIASSTHLTQQDNTKSTSHENIYQNMQFGDIDTLQRFDFLFLISLRDCDQQCDIEEIIQDVIVSELNENSQYTKKFLQKVLSRESCLIVLDGLDEWIHPENSSCRRRPVVVPHRRTGTHCTFITLTRPWKLAQRSMEDINIDRLVSIIGVVDRRKLLEKYVGCMNKHSEVKRDLSDFEQSVTEKMNQLLETPILAVSLLCLWFEKNNLPESVTQIYSSLLDMLGDQSLKSNDKEEIEPQGFSVIPNCLKDKFWCRNNYDLMEKLGMLAFFTLHTVDKQRNVVFSEITVNEYLITKELRERCLKTGILTRRQVPSLNVRKSCYSFLHTTFQEYLAAYYISTQPEQRGKLMQLLAKFYSREEPRWSIEGFFLFVCGLSPRTAEHISDLTDAASTCKELVRQSSLKKKDFNIKTSSVTELLTDAGKLPLKGYNECLQNGYGNKDIKLNYVFIRNINTRGQEGVFGSMWNMYKLKLKDKIATLLWYFTGDNRDHVIRDILLHSGSCLRNILLENPGCVRMYNWLGINELKNLQMLSFTNFYVNCNTCGNFSYAEQRNVILQNQLLTYAQFECIGCQLQVDMTACTGLQGLKIVNSSIMVFVKTTQLRYCALVHYDLSKGNLAQTLNQCQTLEGLSVQHCEHFLGITKSLSNKQHLQDIHINVKADLCVFDMILPDSLRHMTLYIGNMLYYSLGETMSNLPSQLQLMEIGNVDLGDCDIVLPESLNRVRLDTVTMTQRSWSKTMETLPTKLRYIHILNAVLGDCNVILPTSLGHVSFVNVIMTSSSYRKLVDNVLECPNLTIFQLAQCYMSTGEEYLPVIHRIHLLPSRKMVVNGNTQEDIKDNCIPIGKQHVYVEY